MEQLKLDNQICFPFYAISRLITRAYQPFLDQLGITYPQYLVLLVLWEKDKVSVQHIMDRLILNTNTVTPLLKRMEIMGLILRQRDQEDERKLIISLAAQGNEMKNKAASIPEKLLRNTDNKMLDIEEMLAMRNKVQHWIELLNDTK